LHDAIAQAARAVSRGAEEHDLRGGDQARRALGSARPGAWRVPRPLLGTLRFGVHDGPAEEPRAFVALLGRFVGEGQPDVALASAVGEEGEPRRVLHARLAGERLQALGVRARGQLAPDAEATRGL